MPSPAKGMLPAFAGAARALAPRLRSAVASTCRAAPRLAEALASRAQFSAMSPLRGGGNPRGASATAGARGLVGTAAAAADAVENPLLSTDDFPLYDQVKAQHVAPGMKALIKDAEGALAALETRLAENNYEIDCKEFLFELERMSDRIGRAWGVVNHLKAVKDTEELRNAVEAVQPLVVTFNLKTSQSEAVYKAFKAIKEGSQFAGLTGAQKRIVDNEIRDAQLSGVALEGEKKKRFNEIQQELAKLSTSFSNNVLDSTKAYTVRITDKEEVAGLPASALGLASQTAVTKGDKDSTSENGPWIFTLDAPSFLPVQQHARNRQLRQAMYKQYITRASEMTVPAETKMGEVVNAMKAGQVGKRQGLGMMAKRVLNKIGLARPASLDNTPIINRILALRHERAQLLGMRHHADVSNASKMATYEGAMKLMEDLRAKSYDFAVTEMDQLKAFAAKTGFSEKMMPWDMTFYAERQREELYSYQEEDLRPYFSLPRVLDGLFALVTRLFDVEIVAADGKAPVWDKDVRFFQINRAGQAIAYFYLDPYSRPAEKRGGAWMDECASRSQAMASAGKSLRLPVAHMVCNQSPPVGDQPSLMTFREVETLFHEIGHALQHMLTTQDEGLVAGIRGVEWDAVETPSQFMENWCYDKATIDKMAVHYETGESIPSDLWNKVVAAKNYRAGSMMLRQLQFSVTDLQLHAGFQPSVQTSVHDLYKTVAKTYQVQEPMDYDRFLCGFSHIFAGGYSAGYYSYKWAEVLSADCFAAFEEAGLEDETKVKETGTRFRDTILAMGGGAAAPEVFKEFRGRDPTPDALLRHSGLAVAAR